MIQQHPSCNGDTHRNCPPADVSPPADPEKFDQPNVTFSDMPMDPLDGIDFPSPPPEATTDPNPGAATPTQGTGVVCIDESPT
jgi:hypothetical protein